jgi:ribosomal protein S18 acetylase RimI-like enzyme
MYHADVPRILTIERRTFGAPLDSVRALEHFVVPEARPKCLYLEPVTNAGLVAEVGGNVVGFLLGQIDWPTARATMLRLAVMSRHRRRGVSSHLLGSMQSWIEYMRTRLRLRGYDVPPIDVLMRVAERDLPCQLFLRAKGFHCVRILKPDEDGDEEIYLFRSAGLPNTASFTSPKSRYCEKPTP